MQVSETTPRLNPPPPPSPSNPAPATGAPATVDADLGASPPPVAAPAVHEISGWRRLLLWPFGLLLKLWGRSLRFDASPDDVRAYMKKDVPVAIVLWHNRLFLAAEIVRRYRQGRPAYALVSASQDGAWLTAFFSLAGMRTVRGSSSRLGREAATALVEVLKAGYDVGITPDGPRGPLYALKPGSIIVARRTRAPLLLVGAALLIDSHDRAVADEVLALYAALSLRIGPRPTLIEWDNDVPDWQVLAAEAARATALLVPR